MGDITNLLQVLCYSVHLEFSNSGVTRTICGPINNNIIFLKETDITVTNDAWRIAVDIDTRTYQDIISTIRQDLLLVEQNKKESTSISEIRHFELLLKLLEIKLHDFHQILPRVDRRRGLVNFSGSVLNTLFGTAAIANIHLIHDTLNDLHFKVSLAATPHFIKLMISVPLKVPTDTLHSPR